MKENPFIFMRDKLEAHLPPSLQPINDEIKSAAQQFINNKIIDFNLVPREEFEQQKLLLARARQKLEILQARIIELENLQQTKNNPIANNDN